MQTSALEDLRQILIRAAQKTFSRYLEDLTEYPQDKIVAFAEDCAQEALISVLAHLEEFRGDSKFSTWAYKFAVNITLTTARRERRRSAPAELMHDSLVLDQWLFLVEAQPSHDPDLPALKAEIWETIRSVVQNDLTHRQRQVLKWMVFDEVPMDEIVERLKTNRNAIYKLLHDARQKVKRQLLTRGIKLEDALRIFGEEDQG